MANGQGILAKTKRRRSYKGRVFTKYNLEDPRNKPIRVTKPESFMPTACHERNQSLLNERFTQGCRTVFRVSIEAYCRNGMRPLGYIRMPSKYRTIDCPDPAQAAQAIEVILSMMDQLDGKMLAVDDVVA